MHSNSLTKKVLDFLRKNYDEQFNAPSIHRRMYKGREYKKDKKQIKTINTILFRLAKQKLISSKERGFYQANIDLPLLQELENPPSLLHGIVMGCNILKKLQKCPHGPLQDDFSDWAKNLLNVLDFRYDNNNNNNSYQKVMWFDGRRILITVHLNGKMLVHVGCSKKPLDFPNFQRLLTFLDGFLDVLAPFSNRKLVDLLEIGIAKDFRNVRLDGVKSITLKAFSNAWARIYYHDDLKATRFEHHIVPKMTLDDALKSLSILTNPVNYRYESEPEDPYNPSYG